MAAGGGGGRGGLGWLILAAALAVPGFLFYNWWSHLKAEHDHSISAKASKLAGSGVFQTPSPQTGRLVNPMAPSTGAASGFAPSAAAAGGKPPMTPGMTPPATLAGTLPAGTMPAGTAAPASPDAPPAAASAVSLSSSSTIVLSRDPMMSPLDTVRLQELAMAEEERLRALAEANKPRRTHARKVRAQPPIESRIELQGIVAKADGDNLAIINGSTVNPGESFTVENYAGKVRIVKITSSEVTLDYKGRKIKLSVNAD